MLFLPYPPGPNQLANIQDMSIVEKYCDPERASKLSSILGVSICDGKIIKFSIIYTKPVFVTITTELAQELSLSSTMSCALSSSTWRWNSSFTAGEVR